MNLFSSSSVLFLWAQNCLTLSQPLNFLFSVSFSKKLRRNDKFTSMTSSSFVAKNPSFFLVKEPWIPVPILSLVSYIPGEGYVMFCSSSMPADMKSGSLIWWSAGLSEMRGAHNKHNLSRVFQQYIFSVIDILEQSPLKHEEGRTRPSGVSVRI